MLTVIKSSETETLRVILAYMCVRLLVRLYVCHRVGPFWVHFGSTLGPLWVHFWSVVGPFCVQFVSIWGPLGSNWGLFRQELVFTQESTTRQESVFRQECSLDKNSS